MDADDRAAIGDMIAQRLLCHVEGAPSVAGYIAVGDEIDPGPLLQLLAGQGVAIALPHVAKRTEPMRFLRWVPGRPLHPGPLGLLQPPPESDPLAPALVLAPLLGFDRAGGRIGQGAAFYDRAFAALPEARRIGLAWSVQEEAGLPMEEWDMRLDAIATEREWIPC